MRRWPPILWLPVYVGSVLVLMGGTRNPRHTGILIAGTVLIVGSFIGALWLAFGPWRDRPRPRWYVWVVLGGAVAYAVIALGAGITAGWRYAVAAVLAAVVPLTAAALVLAMYRSKTIPLGDEAVDVSEFDHEDSGLGIGHGSGSPDELDLGPGQPDPEAEELREKARRALRRPAVSDEVEALERLKRT